MFLVAVGAIGIIGGMVFAGYLWKWQSSTTLQIKAIQDQGLPISMGELDAFYRIPAGVKDRTAKWTAALDAFSALDQSGVDAKLPIVGSERNPAPLPGEEWENIEDARELLHECKTQLDLLREAAVEEGAVRFPVVDWGYAETDSPHLLSIRFASRLLLLDAFIELRDDHPERVFQDLLTLLSLSNTLKYEPTIISQMVINELLGKLNDELPKLISQSKWTDAQCAELQIAINRLDHREGLARSLIGDRAASLSMIQREDFSVFQGAIEGAYLTVSEQAITALKNPWPIFMADMQAIEIELSLIKSKRFSEYRYTLVATLFPSLKFAATSTCKSVARQRCCLVGLAAHRFRLRHGRFPDSIDEIDSSSYDPGMNLEEIRADPFDGQRLRLIVRSDEIVIYSISQNGKDDQGQGWIVNQPTDDISFRVFRAPAP